MQVITTSSKSLRDKRKAIVNAAIKRQGKNVVDVTPEEGVDRLVRGELAPKLVTWYRQRVKDTGGSIPTMVSDLFTDDECETLNEIESQLWTRTDKATPPKAGGEVGARMALRVLMQSIIPLANPEVFNPENPDSGACFVESVNAGLPKLRTPKGAVASADAESLIRMLLGL